MLFFPPCWNMDYTFGKESIKSSLKQTKEFLFLEWGTLASNMLAEDSRLFLTWTRLFCQPYPWTVLDSGTGLVSSRSLECVLIPYRAQQQPMPVLEWVSKTIGWNHIHVSRVLFCQPRTVFFAISVSVWLKFAPYLRPLPTTWVSFHYTTLLVIWITEGIYCTAWATSLVPTTFSCFPFKDDPGVHGERATWTKPRGPNEQGRQGVVSDFDGMSLRKHL